ncbi:Asp-tRNA(Asn)/Glu-tRNA(Gln) amidotransferase subunit GatA [Algisphaera agarilytica]|uniref:Glutamyl-tRNA(Gln) amidotransferase subunit A n=1 Tax=Algisphaera agarilytica TaxID=1385975 RepID=A0A7X0H6A2_9BACT|nr:Asp-tRNA(Asn)/Glu-tRNA(Gln) amidotransferase subunit GatA [Algisphaera agarilytica]MBB6429928.1 aspartyl-tRNA(Asn)/glutamyl-tRNA(Gln) amidotransferase subunit A [Algisphaera agarilytica]
MRLHLNLCQQTAATLIPMLEAGQTSCVAVMESVLDQIEAREAEVHAFVSVRGRDELLAEAKAVDEMRAAGEEVGPLAGLPVAIKDNICTKGLKTSCSSKMLENFVPPYDATVIEKVVAADGIILGKTNMDEFAMGSSTENSALGNTKNPRDLERVPGGSSGGSAAAVAADMTILALGSDTGGSIRQPASFCGVVGMKPTYGRVSRYGLVAYASSLDQIGPIAKCVEDAALLMGVIAGHDAKDSTCLDVNEPIVADLDNGAGKSYRMGVPAEYTQDGTDPAVQAAVDQTIAKLEALGHEVVPVELPHTDYAIPTYYLIASAEASSNLSRYAGYAYGHRAEDPESIDDMIARSRGEGFGDEVKRRIMLGTYALSSGYDEQYYEKALRVRRLIQQDFDAAFAKCDFIVHAVAPHPAFKLGEKTDDPLAMYLEDIFSVTANLAGLPAISVPVPQEDGTPPIGVQCVAPALREADLLAMAVAMQNAVATPAV